MLKLTQRQKHGFIFENNIRTDIFKIQPKLNDTNIHDIIESENKFNNNETISIKLTGSVYICCGDIIRFASYNFSKKNTIIIGISEKVNQYSIKIKRIIEIDYNIRLHKKLFGSITLEELKDYNNLVKKIPNGRVSNKLYLPQKKELQSIHNMSIVVNPKVDKKDQRRVQCSINWNKLLKLYPEFIISDTNVNDNKIKIRDIEFTKLIYPIK